MILELTVITMVMIMIIILIDEDNDYESRLGYKQSSDSRQIVNKRANKLSVFNTITQLNRIDIYLV